MAENKVTITKLPKVPIGKSDVIFQIETGGGKLGNYELAKAQCTGFPQFDLSE